MNEAADIGPRVPATRRRFPWATSAVAFGLGLAVMWVALKVEFGSLFASGAPTPEVIAREAFEALRDDDFEAYAAYSFTADRIEELVDYMRDHGEPGEFERAEKHLARTGGFEGAAQEQRERGLRRFAEARSLATDDGLDWRLATFHGLHEPGLDLKEKHGLTGGDIEFLVLCQGRRYRFELDDCIHLRDGWLCADGLRYRGRWSGGRSRPSRAWVDDMPVPQSVETSPADVAVPMEEPAPVLEAPPR